MDLTIKPSFSHSLKTKIAVVIKTEDKRLYGSAPLYSCNVATNIGKKFLLLLDKHLLLDKFSKVFNRNNLKVSYRSMPNFASIINPHNKKILNENIAKPTSASASVRDMIRTYSQLHRTDKYS